MRRENLGTIGMVLLFVVIAAVIICFDDIQAMLNETMMEKVAKYVRKLAKQLTDDPTCMTKEEFFARIDEAEKGPRHRMLPDETLDEMLTRLGYV